jgi:target of EGR1 protein 1
VALGLSCFCLLKEDLDASGATNVNKLSFSVQTYNIFLMCSENYTVEPKSMQFLVQHGFDFNKQYASGLPYYRGNDQVSYNWLNVYTCLHSILSLRWQPSKKSESDPPNVRQLFQFLLRSQVPLVLHNAMVDIVFLYHSFYAALPETLSTFLADCAAMYEGGIYDTKYVTEFKVRLSASYLEYVFRAR